MTGNGPLIRCERVAKRYRKKTGHGLGDLARWLWRAARARDEFWALKDVSFELARGEALGVIGPNGSGKSTLLKLLAGVSAPTKGRIEVHGRLAALLELGAGFHYELTGEENICLNGAVLGMTRREIAARFDEIVAFAELAEFISMPVKHYSSGMVARLGFAVAVHSAPEVLLVDEVLSVGDMSFQKKCQERIERLRAEGTALVLVTHSLPLVAQLCERAMLLVEGKVAAQGEPSEVCAAYRARAGG